MLITVFIFLFASLAVAMTIVSPVSREFDTANNLIQSKQSYFLAESGVEDSYYRIKNSQQLGSTDTITLNGNSTTTTITSIGNTEKDITSTGSVSNDQRKISFVSTAGAGTDFNYGLQSGVGGMNISGGTTIHGNIYSDGPVSAISATVTGTAVSADSAALAVDQASGAITAPTAPASTITFGNVSASQDFAQSFQPSGNLLLNQVSFYMKKVGSPSTPTVRLVADSPGSPSTVNIPLGTVTFGTVTTSYAWVTMSFSTNAALVSGMTYWLVLDGSTSSSNYYVMGALADSSYANGTAMYGVYSGSWTAASLDSYFQVSVGGVNGYIGGANYVGGVTIGSGSTGDAWAHTVAGASVAGNLYCITGTNNNKSCNTGHGSAPTVGLPFTSANITTWKTTAAAGGTITGATDCPGGYSSGNCTVNYAGATFGPGKITGNLTVSGGGTLTLTGTIWVVGTITVTGGGKIQLPSNYALNSETIVSDNLVNIAGGGSLGSGNANSFLFIVSTSKCPYDTYCSGSSAITVSGGAGAIAVDAQNGDVALNGGASLDSAVGNSVTMSGGADVTYNTGLASPSFSDGPSGSWTVSSWKESQ